MPLGEGRLTWTVDPKNHVLDGDANGRHLANTIEQSMLDVDAGRLSL